MNDEYWAGADWAWRERAESELDNWRAALGWALGAQGDIVLGQYLAARLALVWHYFSSVEGRRWLRVAQKLVDVRTPALAVAAVELGAASFSDSNATGEFEAALAAARFALKAYREVGCPSGAAHAQFAMASSLLKLKRIVEAEHHLEPISSYVSASPLGL